MIRDLQYPEDARKVIDSLHAGLRYDNSMWDILRSVYLESRGGPVKLCSEFVVKKSSAKLSSRMKLFFFYLSHQTNLKS